MERSEEKKPYEVTSSIVFPCRITANCIVSVTYALNRTTHLYDLNCNQTIQITTVIMCVELIVAFTLCRLTSIVLLACIEMKIAMFE